MIVLPASTTGKILDIGGLHYWKGNDFHVAQLFTYMFMHDTGSIAHLFSTCSPCSCSASLSNACSGTALSVLLYHMWSRSRHYSGIYLDAYSREYGYKDSGQCIWSRIPRNGRRNKSRRYGFHGRLSGRKSSDILQSLPGDDRRVRRHLWCAAGLWNALFPIVRYILCLSPSR